MAVFKCKMCGGNIEFNEGDSVGICDSCGTKQTLPKATDEAVQSLFNRANTLRLKSEFDRAAELYNKIISVDETQAEAYWGLILCKFGIEYVEDPKTFKRVPTCHRTSFESITADEDYKLALKYGDSAQKMLYEAEAKAIDKIQKDILKIAADEKPFDVFICYKETDENGRRTQDSVTANEIYHQLTQEGFKVFYAAITLEDKLGQEYEPYIFAALNSAKVMLVIGSKPEYFTAVWVKNEWSRFLKLMKTDRSKLLIPCYKDMDAYELPDDFAHLQAQDMSKIGFINDIVRGIKKVIKKEEAPKVKETVVVNNGAVNIAPLLKRAFMFLEDGDWNSANEYCEKVLDQDPECAQAYLGKLMAELKVRKQDDLKNCAQPFDSNPNYIKVCRFDKKLEKELNENNCFIIERNQEKHKENVYNSAVSKMNNATTESEFITAALHFKSVLGYKDSDILIEKCLEKAEEARKDKMLQDGKAKMTGDNIDNYESAIKLFESISGWKDADEKISECHRKIEELKQKAEKERLEAERRAEEKRIADEKRNAKIKKIMKIAIPAVAVLIVFIIFIIVLNTVIIPTSKYNKAVKLMEEEKYSEAIAAFKAMDGYKDSNDQLVACQTAIKDNDYNKAVALMNDKKYDEAITAFEAIGEYKDSKDKASECLFLVQKPNLSGIKNGDTVKFGFYEQDNNTTNGKEEIEWIVLNVGGNKALVISKYALDYQQHNSSYTDNTWENCSLRKWLNDRFLNEAFGSKHQEMIETANVSADKNPEYSTYPGSATTDKVFLLSITEAEKYFTTDESRKCAPTAYAKSQGAWTSDYEKTASGFATCWWWLRSPGSYQDYAASVDFDGSVSYYGIYVHRVSGAVRPALWINLDS